MTAPQPSPSSPPSQPAPPRQGAGGSRRRRKGRRRRGGAAKRLAAAAAASPVEGGAPPGPKPADPKPADPKPADPKPATAKASSKASAKASAKASSKASTKPRKGRQQFGVEQKARATLETSAGGIVYRLHGGVPLFLLIRDSYRNWGFPKGHLEHEELPDAAALREVQEETGLAEVALDGAIETIEWFFRFRGKMVHKVCHFYLMRTEHERTVPQRAEGITACRWAPYHEATRLISYPNARGVLRRAHAMLQATDEVGGLMGDPAAGPRRAATGPSVNGRPGSGRPINGLPA
jgi:8-oxo-dGTP pyrophosphatase MutT (NUDIX family)